MLYRMRTGCPWRDLPTEFGNWNKVYKRLQTLAREILNRFLAFGVNGAWHSIGPGLNRPDMPRHANTEG